MMRFYEVTAGRILFDGVDLRDHDLTELRQHFAVVLQDPFLFSGTIGENIRLGNEQIDDETMRRAARDVNVLDFIESLPHGFDEPVRERGSSLSTGQKQLINFARALAYNPRILILDEATSSVDTDTELRIRGALERMVEGRTSVLIAHRLSTVQRADTILVMHKGQLREMGSHQELLAQRGLYWKLYQLQYKDQETRLARAAFARASRAGDLAAQISSAGLQAAVVHLNALDDPRCHPERVAMATSRRICSSSPRGGRRYPALQARRTTAASRYDGIRRFPASPSHWPGLSN